MRKSNQRVRVAFVWVILSGYCSGILAINPTTISGAQTKFETTGDPGLPKSLVSGVSGQAICFNVRILGWPRYSGRRGNDRLQGSVSGLDRDPNGNDLCIAVYVFKMRRFS